LTFLFDENISQLIVDALKALGKPVAYLTDILPRGTDDIALFSRLGELSWFLVTQDKKIKRKNMNSKRCGGPGLEHSFSPEGLKEMWIP
jgi:PIN like domain